MKALFWISAAVILYTYAGYPLGIALLAKLRPRPWRRAAWVSEQPPISVILPVHNGAAMLPEKIAALLAMEPELVREILIVSDGSTDATAEILQKAAEGDDRLRVILLEQQVGKTSALNLAIDQARGEILLFVDIRPQVEAGALAELLSNFADPHVGCVAGELFLGGRGQDATAAAVSGIYWKYEQWIRNCEAAWDSPVGVYGGFYAMRRELATIAPQGLILDDMLQPLAVIRKGYRSVVDRRAVVTDRWPAKAAGEFSRKVRTLAGNFQLVAEAPWVLSPGNRVVFQLVSHKLLRLVVPYFFVAMLLSSAVLGGAYTVFAGLQVGFWMMAALAVRWRLPMVGKIASPASALLVLNAAAVVGLYKFLFTQGPLWKIWKPTAAPLDSPSIEA